MAALTTRDERREQVRRTLWILIGVIVALVVISVVTIIVQH